MRVETARMADRGAYVLAATATGLILLALEVGLRIVDGAAHPDFFHVARTHANTAPGETLRLIDLIRPSPRPALIYELSTGVRGTFVGAEITIDGRGNRGCPSARHPDSPARRIVGLGDSIMFGWGVRDEETFLCRLEQRINAEDPLRPGIATINLGVPGYNTAQEVEAFAAKGLSLEPAVVILYLCGNDAELPTFLLQRDTSWRRSYLYELVRVRLRLLLQGAAFRNRHPPRGLQNRAAFGGRSAIPPAMKSLVGVSAVERALERLAALAAERRVNVVYVGSGGSLDARMRPVAERLGFRIVDAHAHVSAFLARSGRPNTSLRLAARDRHPNAEHHALIADAIYEHALRALVP